MPYRVHMTLAVVDTPQLAMQTRALALSFKVMR
jgi:hypothetical protein